jgi:hypothetical protein
MAEQAETVTQRISALLEAEETAEMPPEAQEEPKKRREPVQEAQPEPDEQPEQVQETEEKPEQDASDEASEDVEETTIGSLSELATELGVDVADLYNLKIPINTEDGRKEVTLGEWKDTLQSVESLNSQKSKLAEQAQQRDEMLQSMNQAMQERLTQSEALIQMAEHELMSQYQNVNWQELRQYDPAEYAAKQQEFQARSGQIQQAKQQALQTAQENMLQQQQMIQSRLPEEHSKLMKLIPSWKDESTAEVERPKVAKYLVDSGFRPEEVSSLVDARLATIAYKAWQFDQLKSSKPATKKLVKIGSKPIKPGRSQSKAEQRASLNADARGRLKKSGSVKDMAALLNSDEYLGDL